MKPDPCSNGTQSERDQFGSDCPDSLKIAADTRLLMQRDWRYIRDFCPKCYDGNKKSFGSSRAVASADILQSRGNPPCQAARVCAMLLSSYPRSYTSTVYDHSWWRAKLETYGLHRACFDTASVMPLAEFDDMVQRMRNGRTAKTPAAAAIRARDIFLVKLLAAVHLRASEAERLTWNESYVAGCHAQNKPCLYQWSDGAWWLFIPGFTNSKRCRDWPLPESVRQDLEQYLFKHRPALVRWPTDLVFLAKARRPKGVDEPDGGSRELATFGKHVPSIAVRRHVVKLVHQYLGHCDDACVSEDPRVANAEDQ